MILTKDEIRRFKESINKGIIKVISFDTETSISQFYSFSTGDQFIDASQLVPGTETKVLLAQYIEGLDNKAKYLKADIKVKKCCGHVIIDDTELLKKFVPIINSAHIVIGQNSKSFDERTVRERCKVLKLDPIQIDFMIDILPLSRRSFRAMSHRLDYRSKQQGLGGKLQTSREDWIAIAEGRAKLEDVMIPYGLKDIEDTATLFWEHELPYYDFPKSTYNKIIKLIADPFEKCEKCRKQHRSSRDVVYDRKNKMFHCKNCESNWPYVEKV